jgi:hypothetical protein
MRVRLSFKETINYYGHLLLAFLIVFIFGYVFFTILQTMILGSGEFSNGFSGLLVLGVNLYLIKYWYDRLKFKSVELPLDDGDFKKLVFKTSQELQWEIKEFSNEKTIAYRNQAVLGIGGERIEIRRNIDKGIVCVNSIPNPEKKGMSYSKTQNDENISIFLANFQVMTSVGDLDEVARKRKVEKEERFWAENEWTLLQRF